MDNFALLLNSQKRDEQLPQSKVVFVKGYFDGPDETVKNSLAFRTGKGKGFYQTQKTVARLDQNFNTMLDLWKFQIKILLEIEKANKKQLKMDNKHKLFMKLRKKDIS